MKAWLAKFRESFLSVLPIFCVVLLIYLLEKYRVGVFADIADYQGGANQITDKDFLAFGVCAFLIAFGLALFNVGAEQSMSEIGQLVGGSLMKKKNLFFIIAMTLILGVFVTIAEPDLAVLSGQLYGISSTAVVWSIGIGVGLFLVIGVLRVIFRKNLNIMFLAFYALVFCLGYFIDPKLMPIAFDAGGVTTGPVTVPFILAFGVGVAASSKGGGDDSFGLTALCSVGPILAVMVLAQFVDVDAISATPYPMDSIPADFGASLAQAILGSMKEVALAILPIIAFFLIYDLLFLRIPAVRLIKIFIGMVYLFIGLVALLAAVNAGFKPLGSKLGQAVGADQDAYPIALVLAFLFGLFGVLAEPAVHVLSQQIEEVSEGTIKAKTVLLVLALGIGTAVMLALIRAEYEFSILYYIVPGYVLALGLSFVVPKIYVAIAFDSGGVASGPMTSTFVLPFCIGFAYSRLLDKGGSPVLTTDIYQYGFGLVAMVAMMPLIVLQLMGLYVKVKKDILYRRARERIVEENDDQIIHFGTEAS